MQNSHQLRSAKATAKAALRSIEGIQGFGIGDQTVRVYVRDTAVARQLPSEIAGVTVECVVVGDISATDDDPKDR